MSAENNFEVDAQGDAGADKVFPMQCSALRKNNHVVIKGRPCKIVDMSTSKTGKHGHAKVHLVGIDIFTGKKLEELCPSTHNMMVPKVETENWIFTYIDDDVLVLYNNAGDEKRDVRVPEGELGQKFRDANKEERELSVTILKAMGEETASKADEITNKD
ncbi:translation initiation factor eIF5A [Whalleya microplaca]|nr:translation initiation factor eIF5A [Whalleya microplaca]